MRFRQKNKHGQLERVGVSLPVCLMYLLLCTLVFTGFTFSRYISGAQGQQKGQVAAGVVVVSHDPDDTSIVMKKPSNYDVPVSESFSFTVSNQGTGSPSEVAIKYDIVVTLKESLPDGVSMKLDEEVSPQVSPDGLTYTFSNAGAFEANSSAKHSHILTFTGDYLIINEGSERDLTLSVQAEQID